MTLDLDLDWWKDLLDLDVILVQVLDLDMVLVHALDLDVFLDQVLDLDVVGLAMELELGIGPGLGPEDCSGPGIGPGCGPVGGIGPGLEPLDLALNRGAESWTWTRPWAGRWTFSWD